MQAWWAAPIGRAVGRGGTGTGITRTGRFYPLVFATHGITPLGYAAFAFALGAAAGALIRRTVPAMAVTLAIFAAVQLAMPLWIRPHLIPPHHTTTTIGRDITFSADPQSNFTLTTGSLPGHPDAWILSSGAVNAAGNLVGTARRPASRQCRAPNPQAWTAWPATASGSPPPTSPPAATGPSSGSRPGSSWPSP